MCNSRTLTSSIPISPEEETSPPRIRKETTTSPSPSTSPFLIGHEDGTTSPRAGLKENGQDSRTPATNQKLQTMSPSSAKPTFKQYKTGVVR
jgi:hypothetical protein